MSKGPPIRPRYIASVGERVYIESTLGTSAHAVIPDAWLRQAKIDFDRESTVAVVQQRYLDEPLVIEASELENS